ncbi:MAG: hypothetical protein P8171_01090 [Candidatus Thiodiazotropha sp.]
MHTWKVNLGFVLIFLVIVLQACGGSDQSDPQPDDNSINQNQSILKVSDVRTLASLHSPTTLFNDSGDGIAIWSVTGFGHSDSRFGGSWLYYSLFDHASESWSQAQRLVDLVDDSGDGALLKLVSNGNGFAVVWRDSDDNLQTIVFDGSKWTATHGASADNTTIIAHQFTISSVNLDSYEIVSNNTGYAITWEEFEGLYVSVFDGSEWNTSQLAEGRNLRSDLAANGEGYLVVWYQPSTEALYASVSQDGTTWDEAVLLNQSALESGYMEVVSNGTGYLVLWEEGGNLVLGDLYDGSVWHGREALISTNNGIDVNVASNGKGYSLVWSDDSTILGRNYTPSSGWSQSTEIFTHSNGHPADSSAANVYDLISNGSGYCVTFIAYDNPEWGHYAAINSRGDDNWETATRLHQDEDRLNGVDTLVSDGESYAVAWSYYDGPFSISDFPDEYKTHYYASVYQDASWNTATEQINSIDGYTPFDILGHDGDYLVIVNKTIDGVKRLSATLYDDKSGWNETETLEGDFDATPVPSITVNPVIGFSVLWHQFNDSATDISTFNNQWNGEQWLGKSLVSEGDYSLGSSRDPLLIDADNGQTFAVWQQYKAGNLALYGNIRNSKGWSQPILLSDSLSPFKPPQIATNGTSFAVSWQEPVESGPFLIKAIVFEVEEWNESLADSAHVLAQNAISATLTSNGRDYMLLYAAPGNDLKYSLVARRYNGTNWLEPVVVSEYSESYASNPQITTNGDTYLAAWFEYGDTYQDMDLVSSEFDGEAWGLTQRISSVLDGTKRNIHWSDFPQLASNGEDYAVFWLDDKKIKSSIYTDSWSATEEIGDINFASGYSWNDRETLSVVSNGEGYAIAWHSSEIQSKSAVFANIYAGTSWSGAQNLSESVTPTVMFDMHDNSRLIEVSGNKYAILWGHRVEEFSNDADALYARVFDGSQWSAITQLNTVMSNNNQYQLASDGTGGFMAAWIGNNGSGKSEILTKAFNGNEWESEEFVDENDFSKYDLNVLGGVNGYQAIWTRAGTGGDPQVRIPWAKFGL